MRERDTYNVGVFGNQSISGVCGSSPVSTISVIASEMKSQLQSVEPCSRTEILCVVSSYIVSHSCSKDQWLVSFNKALATVAS